MARLEQRTKLSFKVSMRGRSIDNGTAGPNTPSLVPARPGHHLEMWGTDPVRYNLITFAGRQPTRYGYGELQWIPQNRRS